MAKIPTLSDAPRLRESDPRQPTQNPNEAGREFGQIGAIADQVSSGMMRLHKKQQAEADKVSYTKNNIALTESFNEVTSQLNEEYRANKPNYEGYSDSAMERMDVHKTMILEQTPESAKAATALAFDQKMASFKNKFKTFESAKKSEFAYNETQSTVEQSGNSSYTKYSPIDTLEQMTQLNNLVSTSSKYDAREKQVLLGKVKDLPKHMVNGVLDRENTSEMRQALNDLQNKEDNPIFSSMDPMDLEKAEKKLRNKLEYKKNESVTASNKNYKNLIAAHKAGMLTGSPQDVQMSNNVKNELIMAHGADDAAPMIDKIEAYEAVSQHQKDNAFSPMDIEKSSSEIAEGSGDRLTSMGSKARVSEILKSAEKQRRKDMETDFASYVTKNDFSASQNSAAMISLIGDPTGRERAANDYFTTVDERAKQSGIPLNKVSYLDKNLKGHYGKISDLMEAGNYKAADAMFQDLDQATGGRGYKLADELDIPKEMAFVSELADPKDRLNALKSMNDKELDGIYKNIATSRNIDDKIVRESLMENDLMSAMSLEDGGTSEGAAHTNAMFNTVHREYKRIISSSPMINDKDAQKQAWGIVEKRYETIEQGGNMIPLPKKYNADNAQNFLDKYSRNADYVSKFNLKVPEGRTSEEMNNGLSSDSRWVYSRKHDGVVLMAKQGDSRYRAVLNKDKQQVVVKYEDLAAEEYSEDEKRKQARNYIKIMGQKYKPSQGRGF